MPQRRPSPTVSGIDPHARQELQATLAARRELGAEHDEALVSGFLDRIEREIDRRVDERVRAVGPRRRRGSTIHPANLALCIPIVAVAGGLAGTVGIICAFLALVTVFLVGELRD